MTRLIGFLVAATIAAAGDGLPGAAPFPPALAGRLRQAVVAKGKSYEPRTMHKNPDGSPRYTNRLILEASPYLLQHAHNPVNWHPWGAGAFEQARREGKPILLSVGYSTCHWCHVMERESFEDEEIASYLNRHYVAVKVDREMRPDVDAIYMDAVQMMSGSGGWPMTVWLTPDGLPFYGGTYFPPRDGSVGGRPGLLTLLRKLREAYDAKPEQVSAAAQDIATRLQADAPAAASETDGVAAMRAAAEGYRRTFDGKNGGFGGAPKFPRTSSLEFLLRYARRSGEVVYADMVRQTLEGMRTGGLRDHVGGGFHRYSTDERWLVPHFEKMLYDNALLAMAYLGGHQVFGDAEHAAVVRETLAFVARDMTDAGGGFFSASDADSGGEEGLYFVWTPAEIGAALGSDRAAWFAPLYGVTPEGNVDGRSVLHLAGSPAAAAQALGVTPGGFARMDREARAQLLEVRQRRQAPDVDRKIVAAWNGLMISAFARAALVLDEPEYMERGGRAADFVLAKMTTGGRLQRSSFDGYAEGIGCLDDYAFFIQALLDLFEATGDVRRLTPAIALQQALDRHFADAARGGYYLAPDDGERLLVRQKPSYDGAEPSGNSVAAMNLLRLAELTGDETYRSRAEQTMAAFAPVLQSAPHAVPAMLSAVDFARGDAREIAIVKPVDGRDDGKALLAVVRRSFVPNRVLVVTEEGAPLDRLAEQLPWLRGKKASGGQATAYVCKRFVCDLPTTRPEVFAAQLAR